MALIVLLTLGCSLILRLVAPPGAHSLWIVTGITLLGLGLLVYGRAVSAPDGGNRFSAAAREASQEEHPLDFFSRTAYWGWIVLLSSLPIFVLSQKLQKPLVVAARPLPVVVKVATVITAAPPVVVTAPEAPTPFPQLRLDGLICNGPRSHSVINGCSVRLGEIVEGVKVVAIEPWGITVDMNGRRKHVLLARR